MHLRKLWERMLDLGFSRVLHDSITGIFPILRKFMPGRRL